MAHSKWRHAAAILLLVGVHAAPAPAQPAVAPAEAAADRAAPSFEELQAMIARMQQRIEGLGAAAEDRDQALRFLEQQVEKAAGEISDTGQANATLRGETAALSGRLATVTRDREQLTSEAGQQTAAVNRLEQRVAALTGELGEARTLLEAARVREQQLTTRIADLEQGADQAGAMAERAAAAETEVVELRRRLAAANELVTHAESQIDQQRDRIDALDEQLTQALSRQVAELERYRSEFFGRLRETLGDRPDLRIVGDRFVFQSELLFAPGSAKLDPVGRSQLQELAQSLQEVAAKIPPEVEWVLRVDGHTDRVPIRNAPYGSNWELSAARAIAVVEFLVEQGIPPAWLAAVGFGEHRPLDPRDDEVAYRRNRRIEFKLTES